MNLSETMERYLGNALQGGVIKDKVTINDQEWTRTTANYNLQKYDFEENFKNFTRHK